MSGKLLYPYGRPTISGLFKSQATDFIVTENLGFEPSGEGEHLFLWIEKSMLTTHELIEHVARDFSVKARDVGYSGLKDKLAITKQWLSLYLPGQMNSLTLPEISKYKIISHAWHHKKLRPGTHRSNQFEAIIRGVKTLPDTSYQQLELIQNQGMANYFGQQRFGQKDDNVARALHAFTNARRARKLSRSKKSMYLSSLRSFLFNSILSRRIGLEYWDKPMPGDVFMLCGSQSIFYEPLSNVLLERIKKFDLSSTVSLYGSGKQLLQDDALALESKVVTEYESIKNCLIQQSSKLQMRATRVAVQGLSVDHDVGAETLHVKAGLPRGSYFTSLLAHFVDTDYRAGQ